ncbi:MAG: CD1108 family mobile element protein [Peptoniphilaceae bacterium]
MSKEKRKAKDKIIQKMSKKGLKEINLSDNTSKNISQKYQETNLQKKSEERQNFSKEESTQKKKINKLSTRPMKEAEDSNLKSSEEERINKEDKNLNQEDYTTLKTGKTNHKYLERKYKNKVRDNLDSRNNKDENIIQKSHIKEKRKDFNSGKGNQSSDYSKDTSKSFNEQSKDGLDKEKKKRTRKITEKFNKERETKNASKTDEINDDTTELTQPLDSPLFIQNDYEELKERLRENVDISKTKEQQGLDFTKNERKNINSKDSNNKKSNHKTKQVSLFWKDQRNKMGLDYDRDNDGVIDRYDADFRDSNTLSLGDLDEREDGRSDNDFIGKGKGEARKKTKSYKDVKNYALKENKESSSNTSSKKDKSQSTKENTKKKKSSKLEFEEGQDKINLNNKSLVKKSMLAGLSTSNHIIRKSVNNTEDENVGKESAEGLKNSVIKIKATSDKVSNFRSKKKIRQLNPKSKKQDKFNHFSNNINETKKNTKRQKKQNKKKLQRKYNHDVRKKSEVAIKGIKEKVKKIFSVFKQGPKKVYVSIIGIIALIFGMMIMLHSCSVLMIGGLGGITASSYQASDLDVTGADVEYTRYEAELLKRIENVEDEYRGYDKYRYTLTSVGHDPHELLAYLTAVYQDFTVDEILSEIKNIFDQQYELKLQELIETYTTTKTYINPRTGETETIEIEHEKEILQVTLIKRNLEDLLFRKMGDDQKETYKILMETKGNFMTFPSPIEGEWKTYISSMYGYRIHPITNNLKMHYGIDIVGAEGTPLKAIFDGKVVEIANDPNGYGNYVVIQDKTGARALYAHCSSVEVSVDSEIKAEEIIGKMGSTGQSTGSHLHLELMDKDGNNLNPYFYLYSEIKELPNTAGTNFNGYTGQYGNPGIAFDDVTVRQLFNEAEKHLGKRYVFGANGPNNFDCSSFVCWSFRVSGVSPNLYRTTAQGIFNKSTPISRSEAKAGDIIFFTGTYNSGVPVSHVGIYAGNGMMIHAGDPIQYTSIDTRYWQNHFYAFGRLN